MHRKYIFLGSNLIRRFLSVIRQAQNILRHLPARPRHRRR